MTKPIGITKVRAQLSALVDRAAAGEEIVLSRAGRPVARLMPLAERQPGVRRSWQVPDVLFLGPADPDEVEADKDGLADAVREGLVAPASLPPGPPPASKPVASLDETLRDLETDREDR